MISGAGSRIAMGAHETNVSIENNFDQHLNAHQVQSFPYTKLPYEVQDMVANQIALTDKNTYLSFTSVIGNKPKSYSRYRFSFSSKMLQKEDKLLSGLRDTIVRARAYLNAIKTKEYSPQFTRAAHKRLSKLESIQWYIRYYRNTPMDLADRDKRDAAYERIISKVEHGHFDSGLRSIIRRHDAIRSMELHFIDLAFDTKKKGAVLEGVRENKRNLMDLDDAHYKRVVDGSKFGSEKLLALLMDPDSWISRMNDGRYKVLLADMSETNQKLNDLLLQQDSWLNLLNDEIVDRISKIVEWDNEKLSTLALEEGSWLHTLDDEKFDRIEKIVEQQEDLKEPENAEGRTNKFDLLDRIINENSDLLTMDDEKFSRVMTTIEYGLDDLAERMLVSDSWMLDLDDEKYRKIVGAYATENDTFIKMTTTPGSWILNESDEKFDRIMNVIEMKDTTLSYEILKYDSPLHTMSDEKFNNYLGNYNSD